MISVILESLGRGKHYPITAFDADSKDIALYKHLKGGDNNETDKD